MRKISTYLSIGASAVAIFALTPAIMASAAPVASTTAAARSAVVISGIYYNSPGSDRGGNASLNAEWVQLHNTSARAITLTGWTLRDTARHVFTFNAYRLRAHGFVKIHTGHGRPTQSNRYWNHSWYIWNNTGDTATVRNAAGASRARCKYSDPNKDRNFTSC
jgi:Lamin Tail Domain